MSFDEIQFVAVATRYIKYKICQSVVPYADIGGVVESLGPYGEEVTKQWFDTMGQLDLTAPQTRDILSRVVNSALIQAVREVQTSIGGTQLNRGLADFHNSFTVDEMLPSCVLA